MSASASSIAHKAHPLQMALFAGGGYFLSSVLASTGIPQYLYQKFPQYQAFANATGDIPGGNDWGAKPIVKGAGVAAFLKTLYDSRKGKLSEGNLNATLPFALGAMLDGPGDSGPQGGGGSSGRW
jgi:hypothetical protein